MSKVWRSALYLSLLVGACLASSCKSKVEMPGTAQEIVTGVSKKLSKAKELEATLSVQADMEVAGSNVVRFVESELTVLKKSEQYRLLVRTDEGGAKTVESVSYKEPVEVDKKETYFAFCKRNGEWSKEEIEERDMLHSLEAHMGGQAETLVKYKDAFSIGETLEEEGRSVTLLKGELPKESLEELICATALTEQTGMDYNQIDKEGWEGTFPVTLWVDRETVSLYRMVVDFQAFMEMAYPQVMDAFLDDYTDGAKGLKAEELGIRARRFEVGVQYGKTSGVEGFELPGEALEAETADPAQDGA